MKLKRSTLMLASGIFIFVMLLELCPLFIGFWYYNRLEKQLAFINSVKGIHAELSTYEKHWLSANAIIVVEITNSKLLPVYNMFGFDANQLPKKFELYVHQKIFYGPIIYQHITDFPHCFSWFKVDTDLVFKQENYPFILLSRINTSSSFKNIDNVMEGKQKLDIEKIYIDRDVLGPVDLKIKTKNLNADAVESLIASFEDVISHGEMYHSQLLQRMKYQFPNILKPGSSFEIKQLSLEMPEGRLQVNGAMVWPEKSFYMPEDLGEFIKNVDFHLSIRVTKNLVEKFIMYFSQMPYFHEMTDADKKILIDTQNDISLAMRRNGIMMMNFVLDNLMTEQDASDLIFLQKNDLYGSEYREAVKQMFLSKRISLVTSYMLYWHYIPVLRDIKMLNEQLQEYENSVANSFNEQLTEWIKNGSVTQTDNEYQVSVSREAGTVKLNNKIMQ